MNLPDREDRPEPRKWPALHSQNGRGQLVGMTPRRVPAKRAMSDEHKAALAAGREESRAVRRYLEALAANRPKRGRKRTTDSIKKRLERIDLDLPSADPLKALQLRQERKDLAAELGAADQKVDLGGLEKEFIRAAKGYSSRKGISYGVWREAGVDAAVLKKAGITRAG
jgi:hypothetical protein